MPKLTAFAIFILGGMQQWEKSPGIVLMLFALLLMAAMIYDKACEIRTRLL